MRLAGLQRTLVLDYLCHSCYTRTARAFAQDSKVHHLDADGDEMVTRREGEKDDVGVSDEDLKQVEIRRGTQQAVYHAPFFVCSRAHIASL